MSKIALSCFHELMGKNCLWYKKERDKYANEKKTYCVEYNKYRKFVNPKISVFFDKALVLSIIYSKGDNNNDWIFEAKESIETLKIVGLIGFYCT